MGTVFILGPDNCCGFCTQRCWQGHDLVQTELFRWAPVNLAIAYEHAYAGCRQPTHTEKQPTIATETEAASSRSTNLGSIAVLNEV